MITKISMKHVASYKDEAILETDKKTTLIYGLNGTGKSTLSGFLYNRTGDVYKECKIDGLLPTNKVLVYNQQFIQDNFYETDDIHGIFTLSKENKEVKTLIDDANKKIKELSLQKDNLDKKMLEIQNNYKRQVEKYQNEIWKIKTNYSGGDRVLEYCLVGLKGKKETLFEHIISLDLPEKDPINTVEELKKEVLQLQGDSGKKPLDSTIEIDLSYIENSTLVSKVIVGNKDSVVSELIDKMNNSDWVNEGLRYVRMDDDEGICPFCQQKTITTILLKQIKDYFDESYENDKKSLERLLEDYEYNVQRIKLRISEYKRKEYFSEDLFELEQCVNDFVSITTENIRKLQEKIKTPSMVVSLASSNEVIRKVNNMVAKNNLKILEYNEKIDNKQKSLNEIKNKFWELMRREYDSMITLYFSLEKNYRQDINKIQNELKITEAEIDVQCKIVSENRKKTVNIDEAVENIKQGLMELGINDFTIEKYSEDEALYHLKRENGGDNIFRTLSEGEKMVISFLYFIELCKGETEVATSSSGKIIVIDDPISSLSHIYVFNIGRLIHNEFLRSEKYEQIFILTHSLYFFYELTCIKHDDRDKMQKLIRICKNSKGSFFVPMKYEEIQNDYQSYWQIVKDENQPPALIANCMRNIIEYFFNFVEKQDFAQIFQRPELQENRFTAFNRYMNRESHSKGQNIFDIKEFDYNNFREAFKLVFETEGYSLHYKKMMK